MNDQQHQYSIRRQLCGLACGALISLGLPLAGSGELAAAPFAGASAMRAAVQESSIVETVRAGVAVRRGGAVAVGPRGGVAARSGAVAVGPRGGAAVRRGAVAVGPRGAVGVRGGVAVVRPVRPWVGRPYYGTIIGGVALGTIIAATAVPLAPADNLCWYWSNQSHTRGYWDYCS
jgi:hypothetical protein